MKFILISPKNRTTYNFRGDLLKEIISKGYEVIVTGPNEEGIDNIKELGVHFVHIPLNKNGLSAIADIKYMLDLRKVFRKEKPDIILGYTIKPIIYGAVAAKLAGVKNINSMVTGVGYIFTAKTIKARAIRIIVTILYRIGFKCADTVIFQNQDDLTEFVERKLVKYENCRVVNGSGVNMQKFVPSPLPQKITFFMLSRIIYCKGVREYLKAAREIKDKYSKVRFMLLGAIENIQDSMKMDDLYPYIRNGVIDYYGETGDVVKYYNQCSVYVLPSYREGIPRTVLEAMAMARPIITTNTNGCRNTVKDGINGYLIPIKDSAALVERLEWFIINQDQIEIMGQASYRLCQDKFDIQKVNKEMLKHMNIT